MAALDDATAYAQAKHYSGSGNWLDLSGNGHHATPVNSPTFTDAGADSYFTCVNTSSQYFAIADHANLQLAAGDSATWAIVFWRIAQIAGHDGLLMKKNSLTDNSRGWGLGTQASNIKAAIADSASRAEPTKTTVVNGVKYIAVGRRNVAADNVVAALDGSLGTPITDPTTLTLTGGAELRICRYSGVGTNYAHARIYAWAFWRRALSDAEISGLGAEFDALTIRPTVTILGALPGSATIAVQQFISLTGPIVAIASTVTVVPQATNIAPAATVVVATAGTADVVTVLQLLDPATTQVIVTTGSPTVAPVADQAIEFDPAQIDVIADSYRVIYDDTYGAGLIVSHRLITSVVVIVTATPGSVTTNRQPRPSWTHFDVDARETVGTEAGAYA